MVFRLDFVHLPWADIHLYSPFVHDVGYKQNLTMTTFIFISFLSVYGESQRKVEHRHPTAQQWSKFCTCESLLLKGSVWFFYQSLSSQQNSLYSVLSMAYIWSCRFLDFFHCIYWECFKDRVGPSLRACFS